MTKLCIKKLIKICQGYTYGESEQQETNMLYEQKLTAYAKPREYGGKSLDR